MKNNIFTTSPSSIALSNLKYSVDNNYLNLRPEYQRDFIWDSRFKRELIISLLNGYPIGSIITRTRISDNGTMEVVDGQQRLNTIYDFINGELSLNGTHSQLATDILNNKWGKNYENKIRKFTDLKEEDRIQFLNKVIPTQNILTDNDDEVREYFAKIQNQEKLRAGEIIASMPITELDDYFIQKENSINNFLEMIDYDDSRKEIHKNIFAVIGYELQKINLGSTNNQIIKFARTFESEEIMKENGIDKQMIISKIDHKIHFMERLDKRIEIGRAKIRFLKLTFILFGILDKNKTINWDKLAKINNLLSEYTSKETRKNEELFKQKLIDNSIINNIDEYIYFEDLYNSFNGAKSKNDVEDIFNFWANRSSI